MRDRSAVFDRLFVVRMYIVNDVRLKSKKLSQETRAKEVQSELRIKSVTDGAWDASCLRQGRKVAVFLSCRKSHFPHIHPFRPPDRSVVSVADCVTIPATSQDPSEDMYALHPSDDAASGRAFS